MYVKDGKKYFIFDSHLHFWDASPANWVKGHEEYAKGWIECFHAYQGLGPAETHWTLEKFQKYTIEDFEKDVFTNGGVDKAVFQSTYLKEWYTTGFNDVDANAALLDRFPGKLIVNGRWDPREGLAGLEQLEADNEKYHFKGVKLYTAEWRGDSKGYRLDDKETYKFLEAAQKLGIKNIHVHKGPTIIPLNKDAFDVGDVDDVATAFQDLNFIVEHCGLPRLDDFCWIATQETNVYAGIAVALPFIHSRPAYFAHVMAELLFWVGPDKILYGSDYGIWTPKWLIDKFMEFEIPEEMTKETGSVLTLENKKKILGLNAARIYNVDIEAQKNKIGAAGGYAHLTAARAAE